MMKIMIEVNKVGIKVDKNCTLFGSLLGSQASYLSREVVNLHAALYSCFDLELGKPIRRPATIKMERSRYGCQEPSVFFFFARLGSNCHIPRACNTGAEPLVEVVFFLIRQEIYFSSSECR